VGRAQAGPQTSYAGGTSPVRLPAAGEILSAKIAVRAAPRSDARRVRVLLHFRSDAQFRIVLAVRARRGTDGRWWYELSLPGRPNGQRGWARGDLLDLTDELPGSLIAATASDTTTGPKDSNF
jgi:hypothetical protein